MGFLEFKYVPRLWKIAEVIKFPKTGKLPYVISSYKIISLLSIVIEIVQKIVVQEFKNNNIGKRPVWI